MQKERHFEKNVCGHMIWKELFNGYKNLWNLEY